MSANLLTEYIERISHLMRSLARSEYGLQPIQLSILRYLTRANRYSNTPLAVADYLGLTRGTVSQSIIVLESKKLIKKTPDKIDGRVVHLHPTRAGHRLVEQAAPDKAIARALKRLPEEEQNGLLVPLQQLLGSMQKDNNMKAFGECRNCRYNSQRGRGIYFCELTQENLSPADIELLCREYEDPLQ